ncbi:MULTISPECIES: ABC transporter substrate-binding protein [unclassified Beijerinckia]|uniref:ABC transporter substrate-binding protein n=1 Tax=unclassified Beijerinckia TaxID=2638183 RepID=UPI000896981A|nr:MULTISPECIES: ABC transporter substrate-binding protein [unclassified Beijerinckia]MDH7799013.1 branched-chain amino acid transport system substrate-binding protein [Beijerinckia sp. GAS462]SED84369.1 ABC-type branched-chain amino acid transport system, substrate-binding protein [Beijerinckia sp. 28-YEA-48]
MRSSRFSLESALLSTVLLIGLSYGATAQAVKPWLIGQIVPLTGPAATVGVRHDRVVKMWADTINKAGGIKGRQVEIVSCNDENRPEKGAACARDMIEKGVVLLLGNTLTASIRAVQPLVKNGPILFVPSPNIMPAADTFVFQVSPSDVHLTESIAAYMRANAAKVIGMVVATDASGEVGVASAREVFPKSNIEVRLARIDLRATDATTQLATVAGKDVPVVYSSYSGAGAITVVKSFRNLGLEQPLIVSYANISESFVDLVKDVRPRRLLGTSVASIVPDLLTDPVLRQRSVDFLDQYRARYSERADMINLGQKIQLDVVESVLNNVADPSNAASVKTYLEATPIQSLQVIKFSPTNHVGLDTSSVAVIELKDGIWTKADPIN